MVGDVSGWEGVTKKGPERKGGGDERCTGEGGVGGLFGAKECLRLREERGR